MSQQPGDLRNGSSDAMLTLTQAASALAVSMPRLRMLVKQGDLVAQINPLDRREKLVAKRAVDTLLSQGGGVRGRKSSSKTGSAVHGLRSPLEADGDALVEWASREQARSGLPQLVRRLILEGSDMVDPPHMRTGGGIFLAGWDGLSFYPGKHPYIPAGVGAWEIGTSRNVKSKADRDYANRLTDHEVNPSESTFIFVTPRRWGGKGEWQRARQREGRWRDVRVYDADDLDAWLQIAPATRVWFSRLIGKEPDGAESLQDWWNNWCHATSPNLSSSIVLAGKEREDDADEVRRRLVDGTTWFALKGDTVEEAISVLASAVETLQQGVGDVLMARAVIVRSASAWRQLVAERRPLLLIPVLEDFDAAEAVRAGHRVVIPLGREAPEVGAMEIRRLRRDPVEGALVASGVPSERARDLATLARRSLQALRRRIAVSPLLRAPSWRTKEMIAVLIPVLLTGRWDGNSESDRAALAELSDQRYDEVERALSWLVNVSDPPVRQVGGVWIASDKFDLWQLIGGFITTVDLGRFRSAVDGVFATPSRFEREAATGVPHWPVVVQRPSGLLREGLVESLALITSENPTVGSIRGQAFADDAVRALLIRTDPGQDTIWPGLADILPLLAESAPGPFLRALSDRLDEVDRAWRETVGGSESPRPLYAAQSSLLWALETLAWDPEYLPDASVSLARLSRLSSANPSIVNSPDASLRSIYLPWLPGTTVSLDNRFSIIDTVAESEPDAMWRLLLALLPRPNDIGHPTAKPRWRTSWVPEREVGVGDPSAYHSHQLALTRVLRMARGRLDRWLELLEQFDHLPAQFKEAVLDALDQDSLQGTDRERAQLWEKLRALVDEHRYFSDAFWRMSEEQIRATERLADRYEPVSVIERVGWLFGQRGYRLLAHGGSEDQAALYEARVEAAAALVREGGLQALLKAAAIFEYPHELGFAAGKGVALSEAGQLDLVCRLCSAELSTRKLAAGLVLGAFTRGGWPWVEKLMDSLVGKLRTEQWGAFLSLLAEDERSIEVAEGLGTDVTLEYWKRFPAERWYPLSVIHRAVHGLSNVGRAAHAVVLLGMNVDREQVPSDIIAETLEDAAGTSLSTAPGDSLYTYYVSELLDRLAADQALDPEVSRQLEWSYARLLRFRRRPELLHQRLQSDPGFFADLVAMAYRGESESDEPVTAESADMATTAYDVLESWSLLPGSQSDGSIDAEAFGRWIDEARDLLRRCDRLRSGDHQIGKLIGKVGLGAGDGAPSAAICSVVERVASSDLERGIVSGAYSARGATVRGLTDGGQQERVLVGTYRTYAKAVRFRWRRIAVVLEQIADIYEGEAGRHDVEATLTEDTWR